ncbi:MAG: PD-(D/E)XK nuclease family protein [Clostridia bacterium]|nr:PD-(D/E)XK nuclease family protein [Clostridia bacterium]
MLQVTGYPTLQEGLQYLKQYVSAAEERGERVTVFCEDRLTLRAEKSICEALGGTFSTSVTTFARFLRFNGKTLSKQGSVMVVGRLLSEYENRLKCLSFHSGAKNGAAAVYEMLSQLFASKVTGEMLLNALPEDGLLRDKLTDLALLYEKYAAFLTQNGYVDENRYLSLLPAAISKSPVIRGETVIFLGFSSFTAQALDGVRAACETAKNVLGLFPAGSAEIYANQSATAFKKALEEYGEVKISQLKIPAEHITAADILRNQLYAPEVFSPSYLPKESGKKVQLRQVQDEEEELRFVCARIQKYIAEGGRYADVAVFVPDVKAYSLLLAKAFGEYDIPYFADLKKSLVSHPFAFFLLSLLRAVADGGSPSAVEQVASSCYFGDNGQYRNYLAKFCNYRGGMKREIKEGDIVKDYDRSYLVSMRERLLLALGLFSRKMTGKQFCLAVRKTYTVFESERVTKSLISSCDDDMQKEYLSKMEKSLEEVLKEAEELLGDASLTASDFSALLEEGLTACEVSLLPLKQDEVFVGDLSQSRVQSNALVFALGMSDAVPLQGEDTALLADKEMQKLETVRIKIEPSVAQVNDRTRESVCLNICSFTEYLYLLYPNQKDEERSESDILRYTRRIFSDTKSEEDLFVYACTAPMPAFKELLFCKDAYREGRGDSREKYASLYTALTSQEDLKEKTQSLFEGKQPVFFVENGEKLFFSSGEVSPTLLENYYTCPYRNFTTMGLKLKEREETAVMLTDAGVFVHSVLESVAKNIENLPDEKSCVSFARQTAEELFTRAKFAPLKDTAAGEYASGRLSEESAQVALQMYRQIKNSNFKVKYVEYDCHLPEARMHGKIDRVDECGEYVRIIDYKTGNIDDTPTSYSVGKKLQLQLYMSAVSAGKTPAGIYYFPASVNYSKEGEAPFRMLGFMNGSEEVIKNSDITLQEGEKSKFFNASLGKNTADKVMSEDDFRHFIAYSVLSGRQGSKELKKGFIAPTPYADSCRYCAYKGMCAALGEAVVRKVEDKVTCKGIAEVVRRETEGK